MTGPGLMDSSIKYAIGCLLAINVIAGIPLFAGEKTAA
jgi:hypothetical protein